MSRGTNKVPVGGSPPPGRPALLAPHLYGSGTPGWRRGGACLHNLSRGRKQGLVRGAGMNHASSRLRPLTVARVLGLRHSPAPGMQPSPGLVRVCTGPQSSGAALLLGRLCIPITWPGSGQSLSGLWDFDMGEKVGYSGLEICQSWKSVSFQPGGWEPDPCLWVVLLKVRGGEVQCGLGS